MTFPGPLLRASRVNEALAEAAQLDATAAHHDLTVLHDDADYRAVARHASDFSEHNICDIS